MTQPIKMTSNKPYIIGAFYDWISDNELTPYIVVDVNVYGVEVPMSYVNDGQIVLNIAASAVGSIVMGETAIEFSARFGGKLEHLVAPYGAIIAIYAKENGAGTSLPVEHPQEEDIISEPENKSPLGVVQSTEKQSSINKENGSATDKSAKGRPSLKVIK